MVVSILTVTESTGSPETGVSVRLDQRVCLGRKIDRERPSESD